MGATFSRLKNWIAEVLSYADLNAEIDNILNNLIPSGIDDMSPTVAAYRLQTDPGETGSESLPSALDEEIKRIRFVLTEIKGGDVNYWFESSSVSLTSLRTAIGGALQSNRISSGAHSTNSSAARFLVPGGSSASFTLDGSPTTFSYVINNTSYSISSDITTTSLGVAPATNNTCLVNDATLTAQESSAYQGEDGTLLNVDAMGTEITAFTGKVACFKVVHSATTEYFLATVKSSTQLSNCYRGYFYDSTGAQIPRTIIADNDTITLMRTAWIFANTSSTVVLTYNPPTFSFTQPAAPNTGDYWYDMSVDYWKTFDSITWNTANAVLIGLTIQDTANCKGARCVEFFSLADTTNNLKLEYTSVTTITQRELFGKVGVGSHIIKFKYTKPAWVITSNLESGYAEAASTTYYAYVTEAGKTILSPLKPYDFTGTEQGSFYHPYEIWRYVGKIQNNSGSDFDQYTLVSPDLYQARVGVRRLENLTLSVSVAGTACTIAVKTLAGTDPSPGDPVTVSFHNSTATSGVYVDRQITAPLSMTLPAGSSLGHMSANAEYVWVHLIDDAGVVDLAVMGRDACVDMNFSASTQISNSATSGTVLYSGLSHSGSKAVRIVGRLSSTQATAGNWITAIADVSVGVTPTITRTDWVAYTPTISVAFGTTTTKNFLYRRDGDSVSVIGSFISGTSTGSVGSIPLPVSTTAIAGLRTYTQIGVFSTNVNIAGSYVLLAGPSDAQIYFSISNGSNDPLTRIAISSIISAGNAVTVLIPNCPVNQWSKYGP